MAENNSNITTQGTPLDDLSLVSWIRQRVMLATGTTDSRLSREREMLGRYYDLQEPKPLHPGNSKYVSADVYDSVETMKSQLLETFTGNAKPVRFTPTGPDDVREAQVATDYTDYVVFRQNDGLKVFHDVIHDGLMCRVGVAQVYWDQKEDWLAEEVQAKDANEAIATIFGLQMTGVKTRRVKQKANDDGSVTIRYEKWMDLSQVRIEAVPPEQFGITPRAVNGDEADIVYRRFKKTYSELRKAGYDQNVLDSLWEDDKVWLDTEPEVIQRFSDVDDASFLGLDNELQKAGKHIVVYEVYAYLDMQGQGKAEHWKVTFSGGRILDKERVSRRPFVYFVPLPRPHSFWGNSYGQRVVPTQNARTLLTRAIIDHAVITTNPRYTVVRGGLVNPKELLENRIGGIVNVTRDDAVQPLMQAPLNPFIFQTMQALDDDREETTGISKLSQGLNKDVISSQNSADMVQQMVGVSQTRQKVVARWFANQFLSNLYLMVYQLVLENEKQAKILQIAGDWVKIDPDDWAERKDVSVEFAIGYGEADKEASKWTNLHAALLQTPGLQRSYGPQQQFAVAKKWMAAKGIPDAETYITDPSKLPPPPPPDPVQQQLQQIPLRDMAVKEGKLQLDQQKIQLDHSRKTTDQGLKATREGSNVNRQDETLQLDRDKFHHQMVIDAAEIALQRKAQTITANPEPR